MPIKYAIHENNLPTNPKGHSAHVQPTYTAGLEEIVARIVGHGTTVAASDLFSALEDFFSAVEELLQEGIFVCTPLASFRVSIKGIFDDTEDSFDPSRHRVMARIVPGPRLRRALRDHAEVIKLGSSLRRPAPRHYVDVNSGTQDSTLTPGGAGRVIGKLLKFDPADARQGVFLTAGNGSVTRAELLIRNMPGELAFVVPALAAGTYTLQVRAVFDGANDVRTGTLEPKLTVS
jgi:hypothetical protein